MIIGPSTPFGVGANGVFALSRVARAAAASGCVPPTGSQRSVQCLVAAPLPPLTLMSRDTFGAAPPGAAAEGAAALPHAVAAAIRKDRALPRARSMSGLMPPWTPAPPARFLTGFPPGHCGMTCRNGLAVTSGRRILGRPDVTVNPTARGERAGAATA